MKFNDILNESSWEKMHNYLTGRFEDDFGLVDIVPLKNAVMKPTDQVMIKCATPEAIDVTYNALKTEFDEFEVVSDKNKMTIIISYKKD